jgi:hypothetical protein
MSCRTSAPASQEIAPSRFKKKIRNETLPKIKITFKVHSSISNILGRTAT